MAVIECRGLRKSYGRVEALRGLDFSVSGRGCVGFLGPNGAGKTTTLRILTGLARPSGGDARVLGLDVVRQRGLVARRVGYLAQSPAFCGHMSGEEFLAWVAELLGLERRAARARCEELLKLLGLWEARRRTIATYSGGMKQRLGIAQALVNRPDVVFFDEPVSSLDPLGRHELLGLIEELKSETTVFMSSHVLADVERVADTVIIVREGRVAAQASLRELQSRYASPVFELEVGRDDPDLTETLRRQPWVAEVVRLGGLYRVVAIDFARARAELPRLVLDAGATLVRYGTESPTLEEVFLRVVNGR